MLHDFEDGTALALNKRGFISKALEQKCLPNNSSNISDKPCWQETESLPRPTIPLGRVPVCFQRDSNRIVMHWLYVLEEAVAVHKALYLISVLTTVYKANNSCGNYTTKRVQSYIVHRSSDACELVETMVVTFHWHSHNMVFIPLSWYLHPTSTLWHHAFTSLCADDIIYSDLLATWQKAKVETWTYLKWTKTGNCKSSPLKWTKWPWIGSDVGSRLEPGRQHGGTLSPEMFHLLWDLLIFILPETEALRLCRNEMKESALYLGSGSGSGSVQRWIQLEH